jgi:hypothetical protein
MVSEILESDNAKTVWRSQRSITYKGIIPKEKRENQKLCWFGKREDPSPIVGRRVGAE